MEKFFGFFHLQQYPQGTDHTHICCAYYKGRACSQTLLSGTYSLCWQGINVWKFSQCWSQYIFLPARSIPLVGRGQLPLSQCMIIEVLRWNKRTLSHDTEALTGWSAVSPGSTYSCGEGVCAAFACKGPRLHLCRYAVADEAKLPWHRERRQVGVAALAKCLQAPESIWGETFLQTRHCIQFVIPRVWTAWGNAHLAWGVRPDSSVLVFLSFVQTNNKQVTSFRLYLSENKNKSKNENPGGNSQKYKLADYLELFRLWNARCIRRASTLWQTTNQSASVIRPDKPHSRYSLQAWISDPPIFASFRPRWHEALKAP